MKAIKKLFIFGVIGLFIPAFVNAAKLELDLEKVDVTANVATIPVKITDIGTDTVIQGIKCTTDYTGVSCTMSNTSNGVLTLTGTETDGTKVGTLTITNNNEGNAVGVQATISYTGGSTSSTKINLGPKPGEEKKSAISKLSKISINQGKMSPAFNSETLEYTVYDLSDTVKSIIFDYSCQDKNCSVHIDGGTQVEGEQKVSLNIGENKVSVISTSEDGASKTTYVFNVFRGETSYNSAKLKSIVVGDYELSPKFKSDTYEYSVTVPYSLVTLATTVTYEAEDDKASVEIKGHDNLVVGENEITISVTNALDTETKKYVIKVTRLDDQDIIVKSYKDGKITFLDSNQAKKELTEEEFEKQYPQEWAKIKNKTYQFDDDGNIIKEEDSKEDKDDKNTKKKSKTWLIILLIILGIVIIGVSGFFIFRKKPEDKNDKKDTKKKKDKEEKQEEDEDAVEEVKEIKDSEKDEDEEDLLNLTDEHELDVKIRSNPEADMDYDVEKEIESVEHTSSKRSVDDTIDIDEALSDLMSTRQYKFTDDDEK